MNERYTPKQVGQIDTTRQLCWIRFGHEGKVLLGGGYDGLVRRWDFTLEDPAELAPIDGFRGWTQAFALHPTEPLVYAADSWGRLACFPYDDEKPAAKWAVDDAHDGWIRTLAITPDGTRLASAGNDGHVRVFDATNGERLHEIAVGDEDVFAVALHPDGRTVVSGDLFCTLKAWDVATGKLVREFDARKLHYYDRDQDVCGLRVLRFRDAGRTLLAAGAEPTSAGRGHGVPVVYFFDWENAERTRRLEQGDKDDGFVNDLAEHPDGFLITITSSQPARGKMVLHRPEEEQPFATDTKMANAHSIALRPDGTGFVVAATNRNSQGNGAVKDEEGKYLGNFSPLHVFAFGE